MSERSDSSLSRALGAAFLAWFIRYGSAVAAVAIAYGIRLAVTEMVGEGLPVFVTFYPAVVFVAILAGVGPGIFALLLGALAASIWVFPPIGHISIDSPVNRIALVLFILVGLLLCVVAELYRRARDRAARSENELALRNSQEALRTSQENQRMAFEAVHAGAWEWGFRGNTSTWSDEAYRLYGLEPGTVTPSHEAWLQVVHPDDRARAEQIVREAAATQHDIDIEFRVNLPEDQEHWLLSRGRLLHDEKNSPVGYRGIVIDVTERRRDRESLARALEQLRLTLEAANLGSWDYRFERGVFAWDPVCQAHWGLHGQDEIAARALIERIHPDDRDRVKLALETAIQGANEGSYQQEYRILWPDGSLHWIASYGRVFFAGEGPARAPTRFVGVNREITDIKRAEETLLQQAELIHRSHDAIIFWRLGGGIERWNRGAEDLYGFTASEALGRVTHELLHTVHPMPWPQIIATLLATGTWEGELRHRTKSGKEVIVSARKVLARGADGIERVMETNRDITERRRSEEALKHAAEELSRSNRDLEQFAYVASHDLQEPLRMVSGFLQLLSQRYAGRLDEKADQYIKFAVDGAQRMGALIQDLLAYSRVNASGRPLEMTSSHAAFEVALQNLRMAIQESGAEVTHDGLPTVRADKTQLTLLFQNLIGNSLKYRSPDRPARVRVSAHEENGHWVFAIEDNGIGFEQQYENKIFQIFGRLHGGGKYPGTGIGLAVCRRIVERHGGRIWAIGELDKGATVYFTVPREGGA